jgi:hypothetical protein
MGNEPFLEAIEKGDGIANEADTNKPYRPQRQRLSVAV